MVYLTGFILSFVSALDDITEEGLSMTSFRAPARLCHSERSRGIIVAEGLIYSGNERKAIFKDDQDKKVFLELLGDGLTTYNIVLYCYVIMDNHFHLLLERPPCVCNLD